MSQVGSDLANSRARKFNLRALPRVARDQSGAAAVEFALVSIPFLALVAFILENGYSMYVQSQLDNAVSRASRLIQVGEAQRGDMDASRFRDRVCADLAVPGGCASRLFVDVRAITPALHHSQGMTQFDNARNSFCPGGGGQYTIVSAVYVTPVISSLWLTSTTTVNGEDVRVLRSTAVMRNEPFTLPVVC